MSCITAGILAKGTYSNSGNQPKTTIATAPLSGLYLVSIIRQTTSGDGVNVGLWWNDGQADQSIAVSGPAQATYSIYVSSGTDIQIEMDLPGGPSSYNIFYAIQSL